MSKKYVYLFSEGDASMRELLGGKGANLAEMTKIGLPVPQGFTVSTEACTQYYEDGRKINAEIQAEIMENIIKMEAICGKKFGLTDSYYDDIGALGDLREILRSRVTYCNSSVLTKKKKRHRLAYDVTSAKHNTLFSLDVDVIVSKKIHNACRSARQEIVVTDKYLTYVRRMEGIYILLGRDSVNDIVLANMLGERKLDENAINLLVCVELIDLCDEISLLGVLGHRDNI